MSGLLNATGAVSGILGKDTLDSDEVTLAKMAAGTDGNIISYDASGDPVAIATGSDHQILTSAGAGNPPAFETGGLTHLYTETHSSSVTDIEIAQSDAAPLFSSTYHTYFIIGHNINYSGDDANIRMRWQYDGSFKSDGLYGYYARDFLVGDASNEAYAYISVGYGASYIQLTPSNHRNSAYVRDEIKMWVTRPFESSRQGMNWEMQHIKGSSGATQIAYGVGTYDATAHPITGIRFFLDSGTFESAIFSCYGMK